LYFSDARMEIRPMKCSKVRALLVALQDGELSRSQEDQVVEHLDACPTCAHELARLEASLPAAPVIRLSPSLRHDLHLSIERALDHADPLPAASSGTTGWRGLLGAEVPVPRGLLVLYAAALLLAIGWAARGSLLPSDTESLARSAELSQIEPATTATLHRPAAYTPSDGWF